MKPKQCTGSEPRNIIIIYEPRSGAGFSDRMMMMRHILKFASRLCARILLPPPFMLLGAYHNGAPVNCSWEWSRYWDWEQLSPVVVNWHDALWYASDLKDAKENVYCTDPSRFDPSPVYFNEKPLEGIKSSYLRSLQMLAKQSGHTPAPNLAAAMRLFLAGTPFVLTILSKEARDTTCDLRSLDSYPQSEGYVTNAKAVPSKTVEWVAREVIAGFENEYLLLHVRRTDTTGDTTRLKNRALPPGACNNTPSSVRLLLNCKVGHFNGLFPAIFLATDETDPHYLGELMGVLKDFTPHPVLADIEAASQLKKKGLDPLGDNFLVYDVFVAMRRQILALPQPHPQVLVVDFGGHGLYHGMNPQELCLRQVTCTRNNNTS